MAAKIAGRIAKYFATSLAIENVVSAPRVISSCLPTSTISMSFVGLESRSTMLPGLARGLGAGVHRHADVGLGERGRVVGAVAGHRDQPAVGLLLADQRELASGVASARKSSTPASSAIFAAVSRLSPVTITVRMPIARSWSKRSRMPSLTTSLR